VTAEADAAKDVDLKETPPVLVALLEEANGLVDAQIVD
jgi:DNA-directed RNA polymerase subunit K/omega